jgi:hypothetical protein
MTLLFSLTCKFSRNSDICSRLVQEWLSHFKTRLWNILRIERRMRISCSRPIFFTIIIYNASHFFSVLPYLLDEAIILWMWLIHKHLPVHRLVMLWNLPAYTSAQSSGHVPPHQSTSKHIFSLYDTIDFWTLTFTLLTPFHEYWRVT